MSVINNMELNENFDKYIKNYNIYQNNLTTNSRVFFLLSMKLKNELNELYINYLNAMNDDEEINNYLTKKQVNKSGINYINLKYKELIKTKQYKLITKIQKKYNIEPQKELVFNFS